MRKQLVFNILKFLFLFILIFSISGCNILEVIFWIIGFPFGASPYVCMSVNKSFLYIGETLYIGGHANVPWWGEWMIEISVEDDRGNVKWSQLYYNVPGKNFYIDESWSATRTGHYVAKEN